MLPRAVIRLPSSEIATKMRELNGGKFERDGPATMRLANGDTHKNERFTKARVAAALFVFLPTALLPERDWCQNPAICGISGGEFPQLETPSVVAVDTFSGVAASGLARQRRRPSAAGAASLMILRRRKAHIFRSFPDPYCTMQ
jgi:hypothetical protein